MAKFDSVPTSIQEWIQNQRAFFSHHRPALAEVDRLPAFWPTSAQHLSWTWIARGATRLTQDLIGNYRTEGYWPEQKQWWNIFRAFNPMTNTASWSWTMNPQHLRNSYKLCALTSTMQRHHAPPPISCQSLPKWRLQSRLSNSCSDEASWVKLLWATTLAPEVHLGTSPKYGNMAII